jgi:hypothetical protein
VPTAYAVENEDNKGAKEKVPTNTFGGNVLLQIIKLLKRGAT